MRMNLKDLQTLVSYLGPRDPGDPRGDGATPSHASVEISEVPIGSSPAFQGVLVKVSYEAGVKNETIEHWYLIAGDGVVKVR